MSAPWQEAVSVLCRILSQRYAMTAVWQLVGLSEQWQDKHMTFWVKTQKQEMG